MADTTSTARSITAPPEDSITTEEKINLKSKFPNPEYNKDSLPLRLKPSSSKKEVETKESKAIKISEEIAPKIADKAFLFTPKIRVIVVIVRTRRDKKERITGLKPFKEKGINTFQIKRNVSAKDNTMPPPFVEENRRSTRTNKATNTSSLPPLQ